MKTIGPPRMDGIVDRGVDIDTASRCLGHGGLVRATRIVPTLIAACLTASTSCSDTAAPTWPRRMAAPATPLATLQGVVQSAPTNSNDAILGRSDGEQAALASQIAAQPSAFQIISR